MSLPSILSFSAHAYWQLKQIGVAPRSSGLVHVEKPIVEIGSLVQRHEVRQPAVI